MPNIIPVIAEDVDVIPTATASYSARGSVDISIFTSILIYLRSRHLPLIWAMLTILYRGQNFKLDLPLVVSGTGEYNKVLIPSRDVVRSERSSSTYEHDTDSVVTLSVAAA